VYWDTAAYATHIVQNHFQDEPNSLGFEVCEYTLSNNSIIASMSTTIMHLLKWPVLTIYELVDLHDYTTLSEPIQLPTPDTLYDEKQVLLGCEEDLQTSLIINSLSIPKIFPNFKPSTLELKEFKKLQDIVF